MNGTVHNRIKVLIEETNSAFYEYDTVNADYAEFASLALSEFKHILHSPSLTRQQLTRMLREGISKHHTSKGTQEREHNPDNWSSFMARHMTRSANRNNNITTHS